LVERLEGPDSQAAVGNFAYRNATKAQRVRPVRGTGGEDALGRIVGVPTGVHFDDVALRQVQPRDDDQLVSNIDPAQANGKARVYVDPHIGCSLSTLLWRILPVLDG